VTEQEAIERIAREVLALGVRPGGCLLVHASLRSLGEVPDRAETAVRGLLAALSPAGTLLMPALSWGLASAADPVFDVRRTPACVGALPEHFRSRPGTLRSVHPTHSVAASGARATEILADHQLDRTPCGPHSPFRRLPELGGQVLFLGCGLGPNTSMHAIEEVAGAPYLLGPAKSFRVIQADGRETRMEVRTHAFEAAGLAQRYGRLGPLMEVSGGGMVVGKILAATAHLLDARAMWKAALAALERDSYFFVERA